MLVTENYLGESEVGDMARNSRRTQQQQKQVIE